jgi:hypothetical protein
VARIIRFLFEFGHPWPLWESGSNHYSTTPTDYGLSPELTGLLRQSYELWADHFDHERGWDSPGNQDRWMTASQQALAVLRREVAVFADVVDERHS